MKLSVYNQEGKAETEILVPKEIFDVKVNRDLLHQVVVSQKANRRRVIASTKDRAEVSGGGRKPWRQKGTGRARHGSSRSPIWRHGGIVFGPDRDIIYKKEIPTKIRRSALFMALSDKAKNNLVIITDSLKAETIKTKTIMEFLNKLPSKGQTAILALPEMNKNLYFSIRNIANVTPVQARELNALDLLSVKYLILPKESIKVLKDNFLGKKSASEKTEKTAEAEKQ